MEATPCPECIFAKIFESMNISAKIFRIIGTLEAISFLLLLGIAMPLKYIWDKPEAVSVVGMIHGILFMAYVYGAFSIKPKLQWSNRTLFIVLLCSVLPFGPFYADKKYVA